MLQTLFYYFAPTKLIFSRSGTPKDLLRDGLKSQLPASLPFLGCLPALVGCCRWAEIQGFRSHLCSGWRSSRLPGREQSCRSFFLCPSTVPGTWGLTWLNECALVLQPQGGLPTCPSFTQLLPPGVSQALHRQGSLRCYLSPGLPQASPPPTDLFYPLATALRGLPTHLAPPTNIHHLY